jgi:hypothetical protein
MLDGYTLRKKGRIRLRFQILSELPNMLFPGRFKMLVSFLERSEIHHS